MKGVQQVRLGSRFVLEKQDFASLTFLFVKQNTNINYMTVVIVTKFSSTMNNLTYFNYWVSNHLRYLEISHTKTGQ